MTTNNTVIAPCTYATCSVADNGQLHYIPSFTGNVFLLVLFVAFLIAHIAIALRYKTWTFLIAMVGGLVLEIVGYAGRIMLHNDDFNENNFIIYLVGLTIGPAFFSAAIYLCLSRVIAVFGTRLSYFRARTITAVFIGCDVISLVLQAGGGGLIANLSGRSPLRQTALNILIAGLAAQVISMTLFICVCLQLAWSIRRNPHQLDPNNSRLRQSRAFKLFLLGKCTSSLAQVMIMVAILTTFKAIAIATITILIRCCYRVAELEGGFQSSLANNQVAFMILDGAMMVIAVSCLTFAHAGPVLGPIWRIQHRNDYIEEHSNSTDAFVVLHETQNK